MFVIACVTTAMVCIMSAFNGIEELVEGLFTTFDAEMSITPAKGKTIDVDTVLFEALQNDPEVTLFSKVIEEDVIIKHQGNPTVAKLLAVDSQFVHLTQVSKMMVSGDYRLEAEGFSFAIPGYGIKTEIGLSNPDEVPNQLISISAPIRGKKLSRYREKALNTELLPVSGVFSVNAELDVKYVMSSLVFAQDLLGFDSTEVSRIDFSLAPEAKPNKVKERLQKQLGDSFMVMTRYDKNAFVHQTNKTEKWATFLILTFILLIAAFNVLASLTMLIIEKRKDIFILKSIGMSRNGVRNIFTYQGIIINVSGALIGVLFGLFLTWVQIEFGVIKLQRSVVPHYPMAIHGSDLLWIMLTVIAIGALFSIGMVRYLVKRFAY